MAVFSNSTVDQLEMVCNHSDYRGPIGVIMINLGQEYCTVTHGMRIAQMVMASVVQASFAKVPLLNATKRGAGGFGSTGL